tara:strand:- start:177 stop:428 length:252 start_codon:yes stop_codon:yes gene_type:complete
MAGVTCYERRNAMSKETQLFVEVRYCLNFGRLEDTDRVPIEFIQDYIEDGGNIMNIDKAMPKQVFVQSKSVISIEEIRKQKYE